ncbi:MAG: mannosyltransferase family protein [bacterium]
MNSFKSFFSRNRESLKVAGLVLIWLCISTLLMVIAANRLYVNPDQAYSWMNSSFLANDANKTLLMMHVRMDSVWYLSIVNNGYVYTGSGLSNIVFFPLYPTLIKIVSLFGVDKILAGILISFTSIVFSSIFLMKLVDKFHKTINKMEAVFIMLIFPTAIFFRVVYTEALFFLLVISFFYFLLSKKYSLALILGLLASFTRLTGIALIVPFFLEYMGILSVKDIYTTIKNIQIKRVMKGILGSLVISLGPIILWTYFLFRFGDFFLFTKVEQAWGRGVGLINLDHFIFISSSLYANLALDICGLLLLIITLIYSFKKLRLSYFAYCLFILLSIIYSGTLMSINRYILVLFPIYLMIGSIKSTNIKNLIFYALISLQMLYIILFVVGYWAG